jgi:hypothetical protein
VGFFSKTGGNSAVLPGGVNVAQGSSKFGGGTLYRGPLAFTGYQPNAAQATTGLGANAQQQALADLSNTAARGFTEEDSRQIGIAQRSADNAESSQRQGMQQEAQRRGQGNGGLQFAGALAAQQGGADRLRASNENIAAQGAQNRFGANQALFGAGAQMEGQAVARGAATDAFNQWASGREGDATQQAYANALGVDTSAQAEEDAYWDRLMGILG